MKVLYITGLCCALFCVFPVHCWKHFHLGRNVEGLPPPIGPDFNESEIEDRYFLQYLHNFHLLLTRTVSQRYFVNDEFFNRTNGKTVFLIIGGAQEASKKWMKYGPWAESAREHGALLFMLEHRLYGKSQITNVFEHTTENLRFTTTDQALEDLAKFISGMNRLYNLPKDVKWFAFGGSYAGTLAAFLRVRNSHLVAGAVSISAPLQARIDFSEYFQVVVNDLRTHSQSCVDNLQKAFKQLDTLVEQQNSDEINALFNLCDSFEDSFNYSKDIANLYHTLSEEFASVAQFQNVQGIWDITTDTLCDILVDNDVGSEIQRLAKINYLILSKNEDSCLEYKYDKMVAEYQNTSVTESSNMRQWFHHTCKNFGWYQTSNQTTQIFGNKFPASFFVDLCQDIYGYSEQLLNVGTFSINNRFGGYNLQGSNILFVHGTLDPWYPLGITETKDERSPVIFIKGTGHCAALYSESESDSDELKEARKQILSTLKSWITDENNEPNQVCTPPRSSNILIALNISFLIGCVISIAVLIMIWRQVKNWGSKNRSSLSSDISLASTIEAKLPEKS